MASCRTRSPSRIMRAGRPPLPTTDSLDPFDPDACLEAGMTQQEALGHFGQSASTASIGSVDIVSHKRACNSATGCNGWSTTTTVSSTAVGLAIAGTGSQVDLAARSSYTELPKLALWRERTTR